MKREELVDRYAACTGRDVSMIHYYEAFAVFKVAVVVQQIYYRYHQGLTKDTRFASMPEVIKVVLRAALRSAEHSSL